MIAKGHYIKGGAPNRSAAASRLKAHFKYIEHRSRDEQEDREGRHLFSKDSDHVERHEAVEDVMEHSSQRVSYHQIVLSPAEDEPVQDWQQWTREVMADLEEEQGKELHWYAAHHSNTEHEHVHVVVAGAGEDHETGRSEAVILSQEDYELVRESGHTHSEHDFYYRLDDVLKEVELQDTVSSAPLVHDQQGYALEDDPFHTTDRDQGEHDR